MLTIFKQNRYYLDLSDNNRKLLTNWKTEVFQQSQSSVNQILYFVLNGRFYVNPLHPLTCVDETDNVISWYYYLENEEI